MQCLKLTNHDNQNQPYGMAIDRRESGGARHYYHRDHLGSTRAVLTADSVTEAYDFMPFGMEMDSPGLTGSGPTRNKFTGHETDEETQLIHMEWRGYLAEFGRFMSVDPLADEFAGWTPYHYVHNNPLIFVDPDGMAAMNSNCCYGLSGSSFERYVGGFFDYTVDRTTTNVQNAATEAGNTTLQMVYDEKIGDGIQMAMEGFQEANVDKSLVGVQTFLDGVADGTGRVETVSALGILNPKTAPVALPLFGVSSSIATTSDIGATTIEAIRLYNGNSTVSNTAQRAGWTFLNYSIPGRISSRYQGREQAAEGMSRAVLTQTQNELRED